MRAWFASVVLIAMPAHAQTFPQPGEGDPRIQTVKYDPAQIIRLSVASGSQTLVELASGENIQTIGIADSTAWQVSPGKRGDFFFIKNVNASSITNMSVVTTARVYNFELAPSDGYDGAVSSFHIRVVYPAQTPQVVAVDSAPSFEYRLSGSKAIRPSRVYQEGMRTVLIWPDEAALPAIFMLENGSESLVNGEMQERRFVLVGTPAKLIFRLDRQTAFATRKVIKSMSDE